MNNNIINFPVDRIKKDPAKDDNAYEDDYLLVGDIFDILPKDIAVEGVYFIAYSRALYPPPEDADDGYDGVTLVSAEGDLPPSILFSTKPYTKMEVIVGDNNEDEMMTKKADATFYTDSGIIVVLPLSSLTTTHSFPDEQVQKILNKKEVVKIPSFTGLAFPTAMGFCAGNLAIGPERADLNEKTTD